MRWGEFRAGCCGLAVVVAVALSGCDSVSCKSYAAFGLSVRVHDAAGTPVCDATVTADDDNYTEVLTPSPGSACSYLGALERRGTYSITATAASGGKVAVADVHVAADECHVKPVSVTVTLGA